VGRGRQRGWSLRTLAIRHDPQAGRGNPGAGRHDLRGERIADIVRVGDTGCGIRPRDKPRIFERFFQADPARSGDSTVRGTGLGLAIVKHACERLGARITIDSEVGQGTTVTVNVPACNEEQ
jgi:signal transduction histidine kinase